MHGLYKRACLGFEFQVAYSKKGLSKITVNMIITTMQEKINLKDDIEYLTNNGFLSRERRLH